MPRTLTRSFTSYGDNLADLLKKKKHRSLTPSVSVAQTTHTAHGRKRGNSLTHLESMEMISKTY